MVGLKFIFHNRAPNKTHKAGRASSWWPRLTLSLRKSLYNVPGVSPTGRQQEAAPSPSTANKSRIALPSLRLAGLGAGVGGPWAWAFRGLGSWAGRTAGEGGVFNLAGRKPQIPPVPAPLEAGGLYREGGERSPTRRPRADPAFRGLRTWPPTTPPPPSVHKQGVGLCAAPLAIVRRHSAGQRCPHRGLPARGSGRGLPSWGEEQRPPPYLARAGASAGSGLGRGGGEGRRGGAGLGPLGGLRMRRPVSFLLLRRVPTSPSGTSPPTA